MNEMSKVNKQTGIKLEDYKVDQKESAGKSKKMIIAALALLSLLLVVYIGGAVHFRDRFFFNTQVNGVDFGGQRADEAREFIENKANDFYISIKGENTQVENIYASEVNLRFVASGSIEGLLTAQNPFAWPISLIRSQETYAEIDISFDETLFNERVSNLEVVMGGQTSPVSASVTLEDQEAVIVPHQYGTIIDVEILQSVLKENIGVLASEFNILEADVFIQPELTTESPEIVAAFEVANHYLSAEITYDVGRDIIVDRNLISQWISIDDELNVHLDEEQVNEWLGEFIGLVNTAGVIQNVGTNGMTGVGQTREFTAHDGRNITVTGGYFGWIVYREQEFDALLANIRNGDVIEREPIYVQRGVSHGAYDWGESFLQVDLTNQQMWAIIDGEVVFDAPIVTGRPGYNTPQGVFSILEMLSPTVLISPWLDDEGEPTYDLDVDYWMRTTWSGYGFHDAPWRRPNSFGGTYYRTGVGRDRGSHGCTNLPLASARELFQMIYVGMPVVVHY